ncbi:hypothetical protein CLAIMM_13386 [Cladophialophora immunda]|nr:hypothetical protein CLAIMM_13386 [Cladophialophora immunda]
MEWVVTSVEMNSAQEDARGSMLIMSLRPPRLRSHRSHRSLRMHLFPPHNDHFHRQNSLSPHTLNVSPNTLICTGVLESLDTTPSLFVACVKNIGSPFPAGNVEPDGSRVRCTLERQNGT